MGQLLTAHGTLVGVGPRGTLVHGPAAPSSPASLNIYEFPDSPYVVLDHASGATFSVRSGAPKGPSHAAIVTHYDDGSFSLLDPWSRYFYSARPNPQGKVLDLDVNRSTVRAWERFSITERTVTPPHFCQLSDLIRDQRVSAHDFLDLLAEPHFNGIHRLISILLSFVSKRDIDIIGATILTDEHLRSRISESYPGDIWGHLALEKLHDWTQGKTGRIRNLSRDFDLLGKAGKDGVNASPTASLNSAARASVMPTKNACLVATARNEGIYLLEWVAYHKAIGFEEIFIYSNNNNDNSNEILSSLAECGEIFWINSDVAPGNDAQSKAYTHALTILPEILEFNWAAFIDIDEFFCLNRQIFSGLIHFLRWHELRETDAIGINWIYLGSSSVARWEDQPLTKRFTSRVGLVNPHIKSIFRPHRAISSQPHFPRAGERKFLSFRGANSAVHTSFLTKLKPDIATAHSDNPNDSHAYIVHFFYKSCEEFLWKFSRNRGDKRMTSGDIEVVLEENFLRGFLAQFEQENGILNLYEETPGFAEEIQRLLDIREVREANDVVKLSFIERSERVMNVYKDALNRDFGENGKRFLSLLNNESSVKEGD